MSTAATMTAERPAYLALREPGWALLSGHGLEVGALHEPAPLPVACTVEYVDAISREEAARLFPEIEAERLVEPTHLRDLDRQGLEGLLDDHYDFVVLSHVIEHVADPIRVLGEVFRVLKPGGAAVIAAPDRHYTFDRRRGNTPFGQLLDQHRREVTTVSDEQYIDLIAAVHPQVMREGSAALDRALTDMRRRREHAHVWDSDAFEDFLQRAMAHLGVNADLLHRSVGRENALEHFSVWRKHAVNGRELAA